MYLFVNEVFYIPSTPAHCFSTDWNSGHIRLSNPLACEQKKPRWRQQQHQTAAAIVAHAATEELIKHLKKKKKIDLLYWIIALQQTGSGECCSADGVDKVFTDIHRQVHLSELPRRTNTVSSQSASLLSPSAVCCCEQHTVHFVGNVRLSVSQPWQVRGLGIYCKSLVNNIMT